MVNYEREAAGRVVALAVADRGGDGGVTFCTIQRLSSGRYIYRGR